MSYTQCRVIVVIYLPTRCFLGIQNSPNDLQMLSDAPAHHLFCLLPPVPPTQNSLPEVLAVVQVRPDEILRFYWGVFANLSP